MRIQDLAKYPFLDEAKELVRSELNSLDNILHQESGGEIVGNATSRLTGAIQFRNQLPDQIPLDRINIELLGYAVARILVSCMKDTRLIDKFAAYEAARALYFLRSDEIDPDLSEGGNRAFVAGRIGIDLDAREIPVIEYVRLTARIRGDGWRLVNRDVVRGKVRISNPEKDDLLKERIHAIIRDPLPLTVPGSLCLRLRAQAEEITRAYQEKILEEFGSVEEENFPPCMRALIDAVTSGANLPHSGRFALTAFLHTIGMAPTEIVEVFCRAPDFDVEKTMYQVEHISGRGGTEYTPPTCATMRTYGLCVNRDTRCKTVSHPLSYYRAAKKGKKPKKDTNGT